MALPTHGRVIVSTTVGEIDIELWSKVRTRLSMKQFHALKLWCIARNTEGVLKLYSACPRRCVQQSYLMACDLNLAFAGRIL